MFHFAFLLRKFIYCAFICVSVCMLFACTPETVSESDIVEINIRDNIFSIPSKFIRVKPSVGEDSFLLSFRNKNLEAFSNIHELNALDEMQHEVSVLVSAPPNPIPMKDFIAYKIRSLDANHKLEREHNLDHYTQAYPEEMYKDDVWFQSKENQDFLVICADEMDVPNYYPHCFLHYREGNVFIKITFDRIFLQDWSLIKGNVENFLTQAKKVGETRDD